LTSFGLVSSGKVWVVPEVSKYIKEDRASEIKPIELADGFQWPNDVRIVPTKVFGTGFTAFVVPDGFLVPFHNDGGIEILTTSNTDFTKKTGQYKISQEKSGFFYHTGAWIDVNNDGRLDFVTSRSDA
jgi:hypothetical protein